MAIFKKKEIIENRSDLIVPDQYETLQSLLPNDFITREKALCIPAVNSSIKFIADTVASIPIKLYREVDGVVEEVKNDNRIKLLNDDTRDTLDSVQFWKAILEDYFLGKGGYAYINKLGNSVKSINYVSDYHISVLKNDDPIFKEFKYQVNGRDYDSYNFLRFLRNTKDGARGTSLVSESSLMLSVAYETLKLEENLVKKGGNKKGFLQAKTKLSQAVLDSLKEGFKNLYSNNTENVVILNEGTEFKESSNTSVEMQINENKTSNARDIFELFGLNQEFMQGKATIEVYDTVFKTAIMPILRMIECSINRDLLFEFEKSGNKVLFFAFDTREILKGDIKTRYEAYKLALESGFKNIDEVRYMENDVAFGIDWINLSLNSVLYNLKTGDVYTPNTNTINNINNPASQSEGSE